MLSTALFFNSRASGKTIALCAGSCHERLAAPAVRRGQATLEGTESLPIIKIKHVNYYVPDKLSRSVIPG